VATARVRPEGENPAVRSSEYSEGGPGGQLGRPLEIIYRSDRRTLLAGPALSFLALRAPGDDETARQGYTTISITARNPSGRLSTGRCSTGR